MNDPNITIEEYIRLEEEKARTATYALLCEPTVSPLNNNEIDFEISFDESDDEDYTVIFDKHSFSYKRIYVDNLKTDSENNDKVDMPSFSSPEPTVSYFNDLYFLKDFEKEFPAIAYNDAPTEPTVSQHIDEFNLKDETSLSEYDEKEQNVLSINIAYLLPIRDMALPPRDQRHHYLRFEGLGYIDADIIDFEERLELMAEGLSGRMLMEHRDAQGQSIFTSRAWRRLFEIRGPLFQLGGVRRRIRWREFILGMSLHTVEEIESVEMSYVGDFLSTTPSYTSIRDPMLRLCHRLIACNIAGRSQAPEKVTVTDLFYLRGMDVGSINIPIFWLDLPVIDMAKLVRLQICEELDDTWAWVAPGPDRQQVAVAGALVVTEDAPIVDEGALVVLAPAQAPQAPPAAGPTRTMTQRLARLEYDVHGMRGALGEQREAGVRYTSYSDYHIRRIRRRSNDASTSASQQPDP
ncbi:hypothetical protein Tco_0004025 [Tanacetum coccineum]